MSHPAPDEWKQLLRLLLAQRFELNAIENALKNAQILNDLQIAEIRTQAAVTAEAWSSRDDDDVMALLKVHSSTLAIMLVPPEQEN